MFRNLTFLIIILLVFQIDLPQLTSKAVWHLSPISKLSPKMSKHKKSEEKARLARERFVKLLQQPKETLAEIMVDHKLTNQHKVRVSLKTEVNLEFNGEKVQFPPEIPVDVITRMDVQSIWDEDREEMVLDVSYHAWKVSLLRIRYALHWSPSGTLLFLKLKETILFKKSNSVLSLAFIKLFMEIYRLMFMVYFM